MQDIARNGNRNSQDHGSGGHRKGGKGHAEGGMDVREGGESRDQDEGGKGLREGGRRQDSQGQIDLLIFGLVALINGNLPSM